MTAPTNIQALVDRLAETLGQSVLIEDAKQQPVWWSTVGPVDRTRLRTVLHRRVDREAADVVGRFRLADIHEPEHVPAVPEADMWARWCVPIRRNHNLLGLLWILDPDGAIRREQLSTAIDCAEQAAGALVSRAREVADLARARDDLVARLLTGPDAVAAADLIRIEGLGPETAVVVDDPGTDGWPLPGGATARTGTPDSLGTSTSGPPLPLADLAEAARRARITRRAIRAGARLADESWSALGAWLLIVEAPASVRPADVHPAVEALRATAHTRLLETALAVLDNGGDVAGAAADLYLHRTTLYYRLDRIRDLTGVDLRTDPSRFDLQLALRLHAYRATGD
ncbi:PucR family transcriptional regulator [Gordonia sp. FQ]|uniref:PucR family transcriptional regulator n=1 Tax=Gordonia sp. FQ TaxID=3446634 RepID=UPI003F8473DC